VDFLSRAILDLAPVISVSANLVMPSLFWAWRLYADPARSTQLVTRNKVIHPSFLPAEFEALAR
jgi:prophage DNA circulation protein